MGDLDLVVIGSTDQGWDPEWDPIRGTVFEDLLSKISKEDMDHAYHRWSKPLVQALGLPPQGCLRKIPIESKKCFRRNVCPLFDSSKCFPEAKKMPWCFEPSGVDTEIARQTATQAIELWRNRVYLIVVR